MLATTDTIYILATLFGGVVTLVVGGASTLLFARFRKRRDDHASVETSVRSLTDTIYGRKPSIFEKHPAPGLEDRVAKVEAILTDQREMLASLIAKATPNGGNTREIGDMVLLIAEKLGIEIPEKRHGEENN